MDRKSALGLSTKKRVGSPRFEDFLTPPENDADTLTYTSSPPPPNLSGNPTLKSSKELENINNQYNPLNEIWPKIGEKTVDDINYRGSPRFQLTPPPYPLTEDTSTIKFKPIISPYTPLPEDNFTKRTTRKTDLNNEKNLDRLYNEYINNVALVPPNEALEFEFKFGTIVGNSPITKIQHKNIMDYLSSKGFVVSDSEYMLRIKCKNNNKGINTIRTEIKGLSNVRIYCQTDDINKISPTVSTFITKTLYNNALPFDKPDYNYRASLNIEKTINAEELPPELLKNWNTHLKDFRYINRSRMTHPIFPLFIDCSIVKTSKKKGNVYQSSTNIHESGVFDSMENYEIEIECDNSKVGKDTEYSTAAKLNDVIKKNIKYIMSGIQDTQYPIGVNEQQNILKNYSELLTNEKEKYKPRFPITPSMFAGPSSYTLELKNILSGDENSIVPNIRTNYCVTDKADGERKLLYINADGHIYLLNMNMDVQFTGAITSNHDVWNTLIDGEHILRNADKKYVNIYAAFDIYYINRIDKRSLTFIDTASIPSNTEKSRFALMAGVINKINAHSVVSKMKPSPIKITHKTFYSIDTENVDSTIFESCKSVWEKYTGGLMGYDVDGLIFTPTNTGVGTDKTGVYTTPEQRAWSKSFKWKPSEMNTIDFMITFKKNADGSDTINNVFDTGMSIYDSNQVVRYKTIVLRTGYSERDHGFSNPSNMVIANKIMPSGEISENSREYRPMQFFPSNPYDDSAGICNLKLREDGNMYTEQGELIENNSIIEFSYDGALEKMWRWKPKRVRYDKTAQLRNGVKKYGNAYHVANNIWHTIHNPVTLEMITTGKNIPDGSDDADDVYYNKKTSVNKTQSMRDFHNDIKRTLLNAVSRPDNTLIDMAVGKAGDLHKWKNDKLKFVFGIDINYDNIHNQRDGAYARYIETYRKHSRMPDALFVVGNSAIDIKTGAGILKDGDKQITNAVFGKGVNNPDLLGKMVAKHYGIAKDGFDICSIQFAIHYMFQSTDALDAFLKNVSSVTKKGGFFIGTCYDGETIFNMLKNKKNGESVIIMSNANFNQSKKICEITKRYEDAVFYDDERSVGLAIDVYQESINKTFKEYLVNFKYLSRLLRETYGFGPISSDELISRHSELDNSSGMFAEIFNKIKIKCNVNASCNSTSNNILNMTPEEQTVSFLNRYFIFKKTENINTTNLKTTLAVKDTYNDSIYTVSSSSIKNINKQDDTFGDASSINASSINASSINASMGDKQKTKMRITPIKRRSLGETASAVSFIPKEVIDTGMVAPLIPQQSVIVDNIAPPVPTKNSKNRVKNIDQPVELGLNAPINLLGTNITEPVIIPAESKRGKPVSKKATLLGNKLLIP